MELGEPDADGRRRPVPIEASEWILPCDHVIKAIGQEKLTPLHQAFGLDTERGYIKADETLRTSNPNVFAGGDCIRLEGDAMTVTATEDGKIAARSIHSQLSQAVASD